MRDLLTEGPPHININQCNPDAKLYIMMWNLDQKLVLMFWKLVVKEIIEIGLAFISKDTTVESKNEGMLKGHMSQKSTLKSQSAQNL